MEQQPTQPLSPFKLIPLTKGLFAKVDEADYEYLMQWKWCATISGSNTPYAMRSMKVNGKKRKIKMHTLLSGAQKPFVTDHADRDSLNNQRDNLRICTPAENMCNKKSIGGVGYLGVTYEQGKYRAKIKHRHIGCYSTPEEAALAYNEQAKVIHGQYANLNIIPNGKYTTENRSMAS